MIKKYKKIRCLDDKKTASRCEAVHYTGDNDKEIEKFIGKGGEVRELRLGPRRIVKVLFIPTCLGRGMPELQIDNYVVRQNIEPEIFVISSTDFELLYELES